MSTTYTLGFARLLSLIHILAVFLCFLAPKLASGQGTTQAPEEVAEQTVQLLLKTDLDSAITVAERWYDAATADRDEVQRGMALYYWAIGTQTAGDYERAADLLLRGMEVLGREEHPIVWALLNNRLGTVQFDLGLEDASASLYRESLSVGRLLNDTVTQRNAYYSLANYHAEFSIDSSLYYFALIRDLINNAPPDPAFNRKFNSAEGRVQQFVGNYAYSAKLLQLAVNDWRAVGDSLQEVNTLNNLVWPLARMGQLDEAQSVLDRVFEISYTLDLPYQRKYGLAAQILIDSIRGDFDGALTSYGRYVLLDDSIRNTAKAARLAELENSYASKEQDREIERMQRENELAIIRGQTQRNYLGLLAAVLILAIALAYVLYRRYRTVERDRATISQQNEDKILLLQEMNHRTKNNLATIEGLLNLQLDSLAHTDAEAALLRSRDRIHAISLISDQLYINDNYGDVDVRAYLNKLIDGLSSGLSDAIIERNIHSIPLDLAYAVPIGLIVNEAVSNALKHGARDRGASRHIVVKLGYEADEASLRLSISDDGPGFTDSGLSKKNYGGLYIIKGLIQQLKGQIQISSDNGATINVKLPYEPPAITL